MEYKIIEENNKLYFKNFHSEGIVEFSDDLAEIQLLKVQCEFRSCGHCKSLIEKIIQYIETEYSNIQKIILSPLPLDPTGLKLNQLISLYSRYNFYRVDNPPRYSPYLMERKVLVA